jgi:hypothetical protein
MVTRKESEHRIMRVEIKGLLCLGSRRLRARFFNPF